VKFELIVRPQGRQWIGLTTPKLSSCTPDEVIELQRGRAWTLIGRPIASCSAMTLENSWFPDRWRLLKLIDASFDRDEPFVLPSRHYHHARELLERNFNLCHTWSTLHLGPVRISFACEPVGQVSGFVPLSGRRARISIHTINEFMVVQPQQYRVKLVDHPLHELTHFIISNTGKIVPRNFSARCYQLYIGKISRFGGRLYAGVNILDASVTHTQERYI
jgi:hypothetical protein